MDNINLIKHRKFSKTVRGFSALHKDLHEKVDSDHPLEEKKSYL